MLHAPFEAYGSMFLRITLPISRAQEYAADRLAASTVGSAPLVSGLRKVGAAAGAFDGYLNTELGPAFDGGYKPPFVAGFTSFLGSQKVSEAIEKITEEELAQGQADAFDSHPPLPERIRAVQGIPDGKPSAHGDSRAIELLDPKGLELLEGELLLAMTGDAELIVGLKKASWDDLPTKLYLPSWRKQAGRLPTGGRPLSELPAVLEDRAGVARTLWGKDAEGADAESIAAALTGLAGSALAAALADAGWTPKAAAGEAVSFLRGEVEVEPFELAGPLLQGALDAAAWSARLSELGVGAAAAGAQPVELSGT